MLFYEWVFAFCAAAVGYGAIVTRIPFGVPTGSLLGIIIKGWLYFKVAEINIVLVIIFLIVKIPQRGSELKLSSFKCMLIHFLLLFFPVSSCINMVLYTRIILERWTEDIKSKQEIKVDPKEAQISLKQLF